MRTSKRKKRHRFIYSPSCIYSFYFSIARFCVVTVLSRYTMMLPSAYRSHMTYASTFHLWAPPPPPNICGHWLRTAVYNLFLQLFIDLILLRHCISYIIFSLHCRIWSVHIYLINVLMPFLCVLHIYVSGKCALQKKTKAFCGDDARWWSRMNALRLMVHISHTHM